MTPDQLMRMTVKDLRALAERQGLPGVAKMRKDELIGLLAPLLVQDKAPEVVPAPAAAPVGSSHREVAPPAPVLHQGPDPGLPIPDRYGIDRIVLLVQDPQHLYVYWEIDAATYHRVAQVAGEGCRPVLVIDTPQGQESREIDLRSGNYYLTVQAQGTFRARLALRSQDGRLHALAADSNTVTTSAMGPSARHDEAWMEVDEHFDQLLARGGNPALGESSLARFTRRRLQTREVSLDQDDLTTDLTIDLGDVDQTDRSSAGLARRRGDQFSSHSLLSSTALTGGLSSHSLSSHSLSSTVFSSHSRYTVQLPVVDQGPSPGLTTGPMATAEAPAPTTSPAGAAPIAPAATPATPTVATPAPARPGQIAGADTVKRTPAPRRRR